MLLKSADNKTKDLETLESLLRHPGAAARTHQLIEREIRNIRAGMKGEAEVAYELDFHFKSRNWLVIHDLRIEHDGRVAQIDHVLLNRFLHMYVCESKRFSEGVAINEQGEFAAFFNHKPYGVPSPIEQNKRHIIVLEDLFRNNVIQLPRRLGLTLKPTLESFVLVSKSARISRPKSPVPGLENVLKSDQFVSRIDLDLKSDSPLSMAKLIGQDTLEDLGRQLVALHSPISVNWAAKFGLESASPARAEDSAAPVQTPSAAGADADSGETKKGSKLVCSGCGVPVSYAVAKFCWSKRRFGGNVCCMACQKNH